MRYYPIAAASTCFFLLSACSSAPKWNAAPASAPTAYTSNAVSESEKSAQIAESEVQRQDRVMKTLAEKGVFFDYDDYLIKSQYRDLIMQNNEFLKSAPKVSVTLQGNADERGSTEYNLALGQKRAEAVKRELKLLGIAEARMEAISFGKEKPRAMCHEEKCWSENRRVDFVFSRKP